MTNKIKNLHKLIFIVSVVLLFVFILVINAQGKTQDQKYLIDYRTYAEAENMVQQGQADQALPNYEQLLAQPPYAESITLLWKAAGILAAQGKLDSAREYYDRIKELYPAVVTKSAFLQEYGELLLTMGNEHGQEYLAQVK